jgi:hypothetical protein
MLRSQDLVDPKVVGIGHAAAEIRLCAILGRVVGHWLPFAERGFQKSAGPLRSSTESVPILRQTAIQPAGLQTAGKALPRIRFSGVRSGMTASLRCDSGKATPWLDNCKPRVMG